MKVAASVGAVASIGMRTSATLAARCTSRKWRKAMNNVDLIIAIIKAMEPSEMSDGECIDAIYDLIKESDWEIPWESELD